MDLKQNLHFNYWLMVASEPLLEEAFKVSHYGRLRDYFLKHMKEERDHVKWMAEDLKKLGVTPVYDFEAAAIAGSQYYHIFHNHPALLLGYMWVLESSPKPLETIDELEKSYGPLRTLRYHAEHDIAHTGDLEAEIEALPEELRGMVIKNAAWVKDAISRELEKLT